ncbi:hypothetical protein AK812_SmicGene46723 [Symbiodinium microadriaticum]|uniref:Uncharacterized protein n=1 Tax=Symbiodinium microadriaticum TaxID=2951 RepID=A0A1Q9BT77_SYMMI|nr:hypothetical protein AK812_SmicGene46723 [Symbiodinium microadriaticum]
MHASAARCLVPQHGNSARCSCGSFSPIASPAAAKVQHPKLRWRIEAKALGVRSGQVPLGPLPRSAEQFPGAACRQPPMLASNVRSCQDLLPSRQRNVTRHHLNLRQ